MATDPTPAGRDAPDPILAEALATLRDRDPERDLWPAIAPQLSRRRGPRLVQMRWPTALAAGLALVAGSAAITQWLSDEPAPAPAQVAVETGPAATPRVGDLPVIPATLGEAGTALEAAIAELTATIARALPQLPPATREEITAAMTALDEAVRDASAAAVERPDDPQAAHYLTNALRRQREMLQRIATAAARS